MRAIWGICALIWLVLAYPLSTVGETFDSGEFIARLTAGICCLLLMEEA